MAKKLFFLSVVLFLCGVVRGAQYLPVGLALTPLGATTAHSCSTKNNITPANIKHYWPGPGGTDDKTKISYPASPSWAAWQNYCVAFYHSGKDYYCFANTFLNGSQDPKVSDNNDFTYKIDGLDWESTEHYFHAKKYQNLQKAHDLFVGIKPGALPTELKKTNSTIAQALKNEPLSFGTNWAEWDKMSPYVMLKAIRAKFSQHDALKKVLLDTYPKMLVENTADAPYEENLWGASRNYTGCNLLGQVLMHVRQEFHDGKLYEFKKDDALYYYQLLSGQTAWQEDTSNVNTYVPDDYRDELKKVPPSKTADVLRILFLNYDPNLKWRVHLYMDQNILRGYENATEIEKNKVSQALANALKSDDKNKIAENVIVLKAVKHDNKTFGFACRYLKAPTTLPLAPLANIASNNRIEKETKDMLLDENAMNTAVNKMKQNNVIPQDTPLPYPPTTETEPKPVVDDSDLIKFVQVLHGMTA